MVKWRSLVKLLSDVRNNGKLLSAGTSERFNLGMPLCHFFHVLTCKIPVLAEMINIHFRLKKQFAKIQSTWKHSNP